jgi:exodeoxyribonuclease V gamma subunit
MLEALLSARRLFYVSWCGHSVRDNSAQPPSVLVSQLRDYLGAGWGQEVVASRTTSHPLQPFSRRYFEADSSLQTQAREWRAAHGPADGDGRAVPSLEAFTPDPRLPLTLTQLASFLRNPVKAFFKQRLRVVFDPEEDAVADEECFGVDGLQEYGLVRDLLATASAVPDPEQEQGAVTLALTRLRRAGALPLKGFGDLKQQALEDVLTTLMHAWHFAQARFPVDAPRQSVRLQQGEVVLEDWIDHLCAGPGLDAHADDQAGDLTTWLQLEPGKLLEKGTKPKARPDKLLAPWLRSLATAANGLNVQGVLVGRDGVLEISPMPQEPARETLCQLLELWQEGMNTPLPLPPKTALAWLTDKSPATQYEGGRNQPGDGEDVCMARMFPDYAALTEDGRFEALAERVYAPLLAWAAAHVSARFHAKEPAESAA